MHADITVKSFERNHLDIFWEFFDVVDTLRYEWRVGRSEGSAGPWEWLSGWVRELYYLRDNIGPHISKIRDFNYIVQVRERGSSDTVEFGPARVVAAPDLIGLELIRQVHMELMLGSGRYVYVLQKRTHGVRCLQCFDEESNIRLRSNCPSCYDTGFAGGGYLSPIRAIADVHEASVDSVSTDFGKTSQIDSAARMSSYPPVKKGDLLITAENERYKVEKATTPSHKSAPYEQNFFLHLLPRGDAEYSIPLELGPLEDVDDLPDARTRTYPTTHEPSAGTSGSLVARRGLFGGVKL